MKLLNKEKRNNSYPFIVIAKALFALGYVGLLCRSLYRPLTPDEYEGVHTGWKIFQGQIIYTDFFQHHHPLTFYLWAGIIKIFGESFFVMRVARAIQFTFFSLTLFFSYRLGSLLFSRQAAWSGLVLLLAFPLFTPCALDIRPDILSITFLSIAFYFLFKGFSGVSRISFGVSGFSLAMSFLCIQKIVIFVPIVGLVLLYEWYYARVTIKNIIIYAVFSGFPIGCYIGYLIYTGRFYDYILCNVIFNTQLLAQSWLWPVKMFVDSLKENAAIWTFFIVGGYFSKKRFQKHFFLIIFLGLLLMAFMKIGFPHYYMPCLLFVAFIAGHGFIEVCKNNNNIATFILIGLTIGQLIRPYSCWFKRPNIFDDQKRIEYVHRVTPKNGCMYNRRPYLNLFRDDLDYLWFVPLEANNFFKDYGKHYDLVSLVKNKQPVFLYEPYDNLLQDSYVEKWYVKDLKYPRLFIRKNFNF